MNALCELLDPVYEGFYANNCKKGVIMDSEINK